MAELTSATRPCYTTIRDSTTPASTAALHLGGVGEWLATLLVRAGAWA
jgi:hypothetical protein